MNIDDLRALAFNARYADSWYELREVVATMLDRAVLLAETEERRLRHEHGLGCAHGVPNSDPVVCQECQDNPECNWNNAMVCECDDAR